MSDNIVVLSGRLRWARSATRHRIARKRTRFVIEHCELAFRIPPPSGGGDHRLVFLGDDEDGLPLEAMAILSEEGDLLVIHSMRLRPRFRVQYEEVKRWRG